MHKVFTTLPNDTPLEMAGGVAMPRNHRLSGFLTENWLCWDVRRAVSIRVIDYFKTYSVMYSLPEVFYKPQICQKCVGAPPSVPSAPRFSRLRRSASVPPV